MRRNCASKLAERVLAAWKKIAGKTGEQSINKFCIKMHLMTQMMISCGFSDVDPPDLKNVFERSVELECETGSTSEKDN
jgi:hypothetical protein